MNRRSPLTAGLASSLAGALLLGGCSSDPADPPDVEASSTAPEEVPSGDTTIDTPNGGQVTTSGELSEGYPSEKVPVIPGKVLASASDPEAGFSVIVLVAGQPKQVAKDAVALLSARGFTVKSRTTTPGSVAVVLTSKRHRVELAATLSGGQTSVNYLVAER